MSRSQTPQEELDDMSEEEKDHLLQRVARETDDEAISRICRLAAQSNEESTS